MRLLRATRGLSQEAAGARVRDQTQTSPASINGFVTALIALDQEVEDTDAGFQWELIQAPCLA
jgi:hypothetical protein